jgi:RHH-type rel operon transcriptional repressor/antitoxin RelB
MCYNDFIEYIDDNIGSLIMTLSIRVNKDIELRLNQLANLTNRPKAFYLRKLIEDNLDDLEDYYLAEQADLKKEKTYTLEEVKQELELDS